MPRPSKTILAWVMGGLVLLLAAVPALAKEAGKTKPAAPQVTGAPGAPGTTTEGKPGSPTAREFPNSRVLPIPTPPFTGTIMPNLINSAPGWPPTIAPPAGSPNVLLILAGQDHFRSGRDQRDTGGHQGDDGRAGEETGPLITRIWNIPARRAAVPGEPQNGGCFESNAYQQTRNDPKQARFEGLPLYLKVEPGEHGCTWGTRCSLRR